MSDSEIKAGDVVQLKSGSPDMTVDGVGGLGGFFRCVWFAGAEKKEADFHAIALKKVALHG